MSFFYSFNKNETVTKQSQYKIIKNKIKKELEMKFSNNLLALVAVIALSGCASKGSVDCGCDAENIPPHKCVQKGFIKEGSMGQIDPSMTLTQKAEVANKEQYKLTYKKLKEEEISLLDDIPVGAIIPHWGEWNFSDRWQICMGQMINDTQSPLFGKKVPDLTSMTPAFHKPTYIAGTLDKKYFNKTFGSNNLPEEKAHTHESKIGANKSIVYPDRNTIQRSTKSAGPYHSHTISVENAGKHDHGGDNKPHSFGLIYLIKIK